jgi:hypothetical protein
MSIFLGSSQIQGLLGSLAIAGSGSTAFSTPAPPISGAAIALNAGLYNNSSSWVNYNANIDVQSSPLVGTSSIGFYQFDGSNDRLALFNGLYANTLIASSSATQSFTMMFYGTVGDLSTRRALIGNESYLTTPSGSDAIFRTDSSPAAGYCHLDLRARQAEAGAVTRFSIPYSSGSIMNFAITYDGVTASSSLYVDGVLTATSGGFGANKYTPFYFNGGEGAKFGSVQGIGGTANFNGTLGGFYVYNRILTGTQISQSAAWFSQGNTVVPTQASGIQDINTAYLGSNLVYAKPTTTTTTTTSTSTTTTSTTTTSTTTTAAPLLLDTYSGSRVAYSLRKLRTAYAGSAVRVRRSNDNSEQDIGFVGEAFDTASLSTFVGSNSAFVTKWYDQSGGARDAAQTTAANQPRIVNAGTIETENGKPSVNFGTNSNNWWLDLPSGALAASNLCSYFQVARVNTFASSNAGVFAPSTDNSKGLEVLQHDVISTPSYLRLNNTAKNNSSNPLWTNNAQGMFTFITNASSTAAWNNASSVTLTSTTAMGTLNFTGVYAIGRYAGGASNVMSGEWQELVIYQSDQTSNRTGIQGNLNTYYGIY